MSKAPIAAEIAPAEITAALAATEFAVSKSMPTARLSVIKAGARQVPAAPGIPPTSSSAAEIATGSEPVPLMVGRRS